MIEFSVFSSSLFSYSFFRPFNFFSCCIFNELTSFTCLCFETSSNRFYCINFKTWCVWRFVLCKRIFRGCSLTLPHSYCENYFFLSKNIFTQIPHGEMNEINVHDKSISITQHHILDRWNLLGMLNSGFYCFWKVWFYSHFKKFVNCWFQNTYVYFWWISQFLRVTISSLTS